jgi:hypothetical protein
MPDAGPLRLLAGSCEPVAATALSTVCHDCFFSKRIGDAIPLIL